MTLRFQAMHNQEWTDRQRSGWISELGKLNRVLQERTEKRATAS